jgi:hypothetical protein
MRRSPATGIHTTRSREMPPAKFMAGWFSTTEDNGRVSRINPATGAPLQTFNAVTPGAGSIRGLSFHTSGNLFAVVNRNNAQGSPTLPDDLYEINLGTQTTSRIGSLGFLSVQPLDVSPSGSFFAWDTQDGQLTVNPATGVAVDVNTSIGGSVEIQPNVFAPDGRLFGAGDTISSITTRRAPSPRSAPAADAMCAASNGSSQSRRLSSWSQRRHGCWLFWDSCGVCSLMQRRLFRNRHPISTSHCELPLRTQNGVLTMRTTRRIRHAQATTSFN